ncbi:MAG: hypothetical protein ACOC2N_01010 [Spirochaetota bacterium]
MRLLEGANLFFLLSLLLVAALFVLGNFQGFLDTSLLMLLDLLSLLSILCIASGVCYVLALLVWMLLRHHFMVLRLLYGLLATATATLAVIAGGALEAFVRPA